MLQHTNFKFHQYKNTMALAFTGCLQNLLAFESEDFMIMQTIRTRQYIYN